MTTRSRVFMKSAAGPLLLSLLLIVLVIPGCSPKSDTAVQPPVAAKKPVELTAHGHTRIDEYFWLRERENPEVIAYLEAENAYTQAAMKHTEVLQSKLFDEIVGRIQAVDMSVPYRKNEYYYYTRFEEGGEYPLHCRKKGSLDAPEEILLDVPAMAEGQAYFHVAGLSVSPDNRLLAFGTDTVSRRLYTLQIKNLETGEILPERMINTSGSAAWADDNATFFYTVKDPTTLRTFRIMRHVLGTDPSDDVEVFAENDETFSAGVYRTKSDAYIMIASMSTLSNEFRFLETGRPAGEFKIVQPRERNLEYSVEHLGNVFYILTNDKAENFRLVSAPVSRPGKAHWTEVIPHRPDVLIQGIEVFKDYLVVGERKAGLTHMRVIRWKDRSEHHLDFGEETYAVFPSQNPEIETEVVRYRYTSLTTPMSVFDYNMRTQEKTLLKQDEVVGGYDPSAYHAERFHAAAADGIEVPISLVYRKDLKTDGPQPLLLYGYGSYGASTDPTFSSVRLSLLDHGFIYAIAHIRGGQEMGRAWYEDGKLLNKKNTFTDFIACAEHLIDRQYTEPGKLFAMGGSAGGLLMGAVVNMRPELFRGVIAAVPWVDVITTMLDSSIPLTTSEYDEWGNPNDKEYYDYMLSYSPYDNVEAKDYPAMLVTTGLHDSQVQYWEPAKWVARMRALKTGDAPLFLWTNFDAGHGGASGRFQRFRETAMEYAFLLDRAGIRE
ncbi:MAG: S9 family peptidase [Acidobacteriota bacterium]|nr:S9 family peptidase [Acidobacteriota bacterium]